MEPENEPLMTFGTIFLYTPRAFRFHESYSVRDLYIPGKLSGSGEEM